jgi:hypothetical protein
MPERTKPRPDGPARSHSFYGTGDTGDAWARVRREISQAGEPVTERLTLSTHAHRSDHPAWLAQFGNAQVRDIYGIQVAELAGVRLPGGSPQARQAFIAGYQAREPGVWSYYPWLNVALRTLEPEALFELRTNRNRNLVTRPEQAVLRTAHVAIAGLSVGGNIVSALVHHGIGGTFSLADHDELAPRPDLAGDRQAQVPAGAGRAATAALAAGHRRPLCR